MPKKDRKIVLIIIVTLAVILLCACTGVAIMYFMRNQVSVPEETVEPEPEETSEPVHRDPIVDTEDEDSYYAIMARQDIKDLHEYAEEDWMLVVEEDVPIEFTPPEYAPNDFHSYAYQTAVTELDIEFQMIYNYIVNFMETNRNMEDFVPDTRMMANLYGYYVANYTYMENEAIGHNIKWKFIMGTMDDTPEDHYTVLVYRCDYYTDDYTGTRTEGATVE